jgi:branched-chain amino acid transport system substrate-binding protein
LQKARRLVEQNNVHFLTGNLLANTGLAVANYVKGTGTPYFIPIIAADELTQRGRIPNVIRTAGYSGSAFPRPLADWALKQGYKRIATISQDYTFGHEQCGGFSQVFTEGGGTIVQQFWHPLNTADFSPYLGQIADLKIDAIFVMETGADATRFTQQFNSFGLKGKIPLLGAMNMTDQSVIRTMGAEVEGIISAAHFAEGADIAATKDFDGVTGKITLDAHRNPTKPAVMLQVKNGKFSYIETIAP